MGVLSNFMRSLRRTFCTAVVVAAGTSERMGQDKLFLSVGGIPVLAHSMMTLNRCKDVNEIILVTRPEQLDAAESLRREYRLDKLLKIVFGGATRTESALAGVTAANRKASIICIHDGARPFVTEAIVEEAIHTAILYKAAAPAVPVKDTIKTAEKGVVTGTPDRTTLFAVQTPQTFNATLIKGALTKAKRDKRTYTDDCAAVEALGVKVHLTAGDEANLKITTPADIDRAELIFRQRQKGAAGEG